MSFSKCPIPRLPTSPYVPILRPSTFRVFSTTLSPAPYEERRRPSPTSPNRSRQSCRRSLQTSAPLQGGRAASFTKLRRPNTLAEQAERQRSEDYMISETRSTNVEIGEKQRSGNLPDDIGLIMGTLVMPKFGEGVLRKYHLFGEGFLTAWRIQRKRFVKRYRDFFSVWSSAYKGGYQVFPKLRIRDTKRIAKDLHEQMYIAFANGEPRDLQTIHDITCETLRENLRSRMLARPEGLSYTWECEYIGTPRVMSHRAAVLPLDEERAGTVSAIRQAVVRIQTVQSLLRNTEDMEIVNDEHKTQQDPETLKRHEQLQEEVYQVPMTEFFVIQKRKMHGVEEEWKIWGTTEETELIEEALDETPKTAAVNT